MASDEMGGWIMAKDEIVDFWLDSIRLSIAM